MLILYKGKEKDPLRNWPSSQKIKNILLFLMTIFYFVTVFDSYAEYRLKYGDVFGNKDESSMKEGKKSTVLFQCPCILEVAFCNHVQFKQGRSMVVRFFTQSVGKN